MGCEMLKGKTEWVISDFLFLGYFRCEKKIRHNFRSET